MEPLPSCKDLSAMIYPYENKDTLMITIITFLCPANQERSFLIDVSVVQHSLFSYESVAWLSRDGSTYLFARA